ncbi:hypothetical protein NJB18091_34250 [Mycobacterium marinum]|nr:hypothetical protein NJB18091_34250 [Mycobacterium marinum]
MAMAISTRAASVSTAATAGLAAPQDLPASMALVPLAMPATAAMAGPAGTAVSARREQMAWGQELPAVSAPKVAMAVRVVPVEPA